MLSLLAGWLAAPPHTGGWAHRRMASSWRFQRVDRPLAPGAPDIVVGTGQSSESSDWLAGWPLLACLRGRQPSGSEASSVDSIHGTEGEGGGGVRKPLAWKPRMSPSSFGAGSDDELWPLAGRH